MKHVASAILLTCILSACGTTSRPGSAGSSVDGETGGLGLVTGTWRFSHFGAPTIKSDRVPNPGKEVRKHLSGTTIAIEETGNISFVAPGHAVSYRVSVFEETPLYLRIGVKEQPSSEAFVYEKSTGLIMMPGKLQIDGESGVLPTYFKRIR